MLTKIQEMFFALKIAPCDVSGAITPEFYTQNLNYTLNIYSIVIRKRLNEKKISE